MATADLTALVLTNESEDAAAPAGAVGTPIAALVGGGNVTDADAGAPRGLAVTGADTAHGKWFYSTNGGTTWIALGSVAEGNARLLAADAGTRIYFQPDANFNGSIDPALTFHAWDQSSGTNGGAANLTIIRTGGTSAFSTATDTASLSITSVNDPPSFTRGPNQTVDEDSGPQTVSGWATNISAGPPDESGQTVHFNVVDNTNPGLFNSGPTIGTNGALTYTPAANANGTATITIMAQDDGGTSGGGRDISAAQTFQITINPVNDAPVAFIAAATYVATEQVSMNLKNTGISVSDVDAVLVPSGVETATLSVTEGILNVAAGSSGVLVSNSGTSSVTLEGTLAQINALLNTNPTSSVSYVDPTNLPSPTATLTLTIHDNGRTGAGGDLFASDTAIINITPVNDAVADFNGDGHTDLLWRQDDGQTAIWLMNGSRIVVGFDLGKIGTSWRALDRGDFDGDSRADILWRNDDGQTAIWEMDGGIIKRGVSLGVIGSPWQLQPIGDFDGDGKSDLLWRNEQTGETGLWEMNGGEIKAGISLGVIGAGWHVAGVADFDGDGKSDILWRHDSGQTAIWAMNGGQIKAGFGLGTIATSSHVVGTGDFDGDGKDDILWHDDNGLTAIWEMNGGQIKHTDNLGVIGPSWHVATIGDFDGNGTSDLLWRDDNGQTALWQMNGGQTIAGADLGLIASAWHVVSDHLLV